MAKVCTLGKMDVSMKVSTRMTRNMDLEFTLGQMADNIKAIGMKESNMEKEFTGCRMENRERVSGIMESGYNGLKNETFFMVCIIQLIRFCE